MIKVGSDFSGVGAFDQALIRLGIDYENVFSCDMDKYARDTYVLNYGEPKYYPKNVYEREIPKEPLDIYMTSPPCQAFSLAGMRKGEDDDRGILFYNSLEFIRVNNPRYFIFENVKGLLSDNGGHTFRKWVDLLGGVSINGQPNLFPHYDSVPYHLYYSVLNAKDYGVPQNRERVFLIGIRDDVDNNFSFPKKEFLSKRLKDVLESDVDEKYFLSERAINGFINHTNRQKEKGNGFKFEVKGCDDIASAITTRSGSRCDDNFIKVKSATKKGWEVARIGEDSINLERRESKTRRGCVGVGVAQTLTTSCNQGVATFNYPKVSIKLTGGKWDKTFEQSRRVYDDNGVSPTIPTMCGGNQEIKVLIDSCRIRRLTPRECFRLMDFPDSFIWNVSDSQAYKQAGNSIVVSVLEKIIKKILWKR